jgi:uncharacterized protein
MHVRGKRVSITGASRGIGESLAHAFVAAGATVALVARSEKILASLAGELGEPPTPADLSDPAQVASLIPRIEDEAGPVDILVNNAGTDSAAGFMDAPDDELRRVTQVNYLSPAELCRKVILRMLGPGADTSSISPLWPASSRSQGERATRRRRQPYPTSLRGSGPICVDCRSA